MEKKKPLPELNYNPDPSAIDSMMTGETPDAARYDALADQAGLPQKPRFEPPAPTGDGPSKWDQVMAYMQPKLANLTKPVPGSYSEMGFDTKTGKDDGMINGDVFPSGSPFGSHDDRKPAVVQNEAGFGAAQGVDAGNAGAQSPDDAAAKSAAVERFVQSSKGQSPDASADPKSYGYKDDRNDDALKAALAGRQEDQFHNNLGRAFNRMSAGIGHQKLDNSFYDNMDKQADTRVGDIGTLRKGQTDERDFAEKMKQDDPNDPANQAFRSMLFKAMPGFKNMPGSDSITLANPGPFVSIADTFQKTEATKAANESNRLMKEAQMTALGQERNRKEADLTSNKLRGDKQYTSAVAGEDAARQAIDSLDLARTDPIAFGSKAIETARAIVGGGRISQQEIQQLSGDQSIAGRLKQMAQTATTGTISDDNYRFYKQLIQLSLKHAQEDKAKAIDSYVSTYARHNNKDADTAYEDVVGKKRPQQSAGTSNEDAQAVEWAKANPTDHRAVKILKLHGLK